MTIRELRDELAQFDENMEIRIMNGMWAVPINNIDTEDGIVLLENYDD